MTAEQVFLGSGAVREKFFLWRTIGIRARPEDAKPFRLGSEHEISALNRTLARSEISPGSAREGMNWQASNRPTRYSDGTFGVVYFSFERLTSVTERFHWALAELSSVGALRSCCVRLEVLKAEFFGAVRDLRSACPPFTMMVHPSDYSFCHDVGRIAYKSEDTDGVVVRSARVLNGSNLPVFRDSAIAHVREIDAVTVFVRESPLNAVLLMDGSEVSVLSDDVYSALSC